tara:strand:+ start:1736 stop:2017 length:282 start_codon:yes stop_codon:yes gene_type:complete
MLVTIIILSITTLIFLFGVINLLRKNEAYEDVVEEQEVLISDIASKVDDSMKKMKEIDTIGSFEADDDVGFIFKSLYEVIEELERYYGSKEEE